MPASLAASLVLPKRRPTTPAPMFRLGLNADGWWVICEASGSCGGIFRTRAAAIKYARNESTDGNFTIVHEPGGLELAPLGTKAAA